MREALFYVAGAATIMTFLSLLCLISIERVREGAGIVGVRAQGSSHLQCSG